MGIVCIVEPNDERTRLWYVYVDYRADDGKPFYVGKGDIHRVARKVRNRHHKNVVAKHGLRRELVLETDDEQHSFHEEIRLIAELKTRDYYGGCNYTDGGDGVSGFKQTSTMIERNREVHTGLVQSDAVCQQKRISMRASSRVKRRPVIQLDIDENIVGHHPSVGLAAVSLGRPEATSLISRCCRGKTRQAYGFIWRYVNESTTSFDCMGNKVSNKARIVEQLEITSGLVVSTYPSISEAAKSLDKANVSIRQCCHGKRQTAHGFVWRFKSEPNLGVAS
jgi:hypothetical protein